MKNKVMSGLIKRHPDGFGFFIPDDTEHPDVYIPRSSMKGVMTGDRVMVEAIEDKRDHRFSGRILKITDRGTKVLLGTFYKINEFKGLIRDESKAWGDDLKITINPQVKNGPALEHGQLVTAEIISYPDEEAGFVGKILTVIGDAQDPLTDSKKVLIQQQIPHTFPETVEKESHNYSEQVDVKDIQSRKDLRSLNFITIDGATAKDFDDAIYIDVLSSGFKLYVAIADVSHYVRPGSAIDQEAYTRGTSVYFPNFVVPMLPEVLSNGLCSLIPHVPRLSLVAEMNFDFTGEMQSSTFYEATIESKARVTYGEAQDILDGNKNPKLDHVEKDILRAADLAKLLMAKRFREGSLDLEIPEVQMVLNPEGIPVDFIRSERLFAHRLIEEMMLAANVAVAKFLSAKEIPAIYRIHDSPNADAIEILERYLEKFGGDVGLQSKGKLQKRLTKALQQFDGKPEAQILNILALRSMSQAKYSANNIGHFGLGFEYYTHFTSPIRRYPDLIVHRLIKSLIIPRQGYPSIDEATLQTSATMLSACEQRSVKAERQFVSIKKARFMETHLGEEFEGIVSSVAKFGVFVLLRKFEVDGLIRLESLSKEPLLFDEDRLVLFGKRSGVTFSVGDHVLIEVTAVDVDQGQVDFELVEVISHVEPIVEPAIKFGKLHFKNKKSERNYSSSKDSRSSQKRNSEYSRNSQQRPQKSSGKKKQEDSSRETKKSSSSHQEFRQKSQQSKSHQKSDKNSKRNESHPSLSKKLRAAEKYETKSRSEMGKHRDKLQEDRDSSAQLNSLNAKSSPESKTSGGFDPERHFQNALKKWKERNQGSGQKKSADEKSRSSSRNQERTERRDEGRPDRRDDNRKDRRGENAAQKGERNKKGFRR